MIVFLIGSGNAQSQKSAGQENDTSQNGPKIEQVETERDYYKDMQRSKEKKNKDSFSIQSKKSIVVKDMDKTNSPSKIYSSDSVKPNQIINRDGAIHFGQGKEQIYSKSRIQKKLARVEGYAERVEIKKIEGHSPVSEEVLMRALGNPKRVEAKSSKTK